MGTHTPGPWTVEEYGDDDALALVIHKDTETRVCFMATPGSHGDPAKIEADARLIAAAPDMLAALKCARAVIDPDRSPETYALVYAAIIKAEGATKPDTGTAAMGTKDERDYDPDVAPCDDAEFGMKP